MKKLIQELIEFDWVGFVLLLFSKTGFIVDGVRRSTFLNPGVCLEMLESLKGADQFRLYEVDDKGEKTRVIL